MFSNFKDQKILKLMLIISFLLSNWRYQRIISNFTESNSNFTTYKLLTVPEVFNNRAVRKMVLLQSTIQTICSQKINNYISNLSSAIWKVQVAKKKTHLINTHTFFPLANLLLLLLWVRDLQIFSHLKLKANNGPSI